MTGIDDVYAAALGENARPFQYQRRLAEDGLPEVLNVPTGCGKTPAVLLAWLYRRFLHPDQAVRSSEPTRLIWCLPLRTLTTQTATLARRWVENLGLDDHVDVHLLMGGEAVPAQRWRLEPARPAIIVSTLDMALSRALNRGYLASRYAWPVDFALFNDDCHWVFDEIQLMGVALGTSRQLHGLRDKLGVPTRHASTWMSATVDPASMSTIDAPTLGEVVALTETDRSDSALGQRLTAPKTLVRRRLDDPAKFAASVAAVARSEHVHGTVTLLVVNTVKAAQEIARLVRRSPIVDDADVVLLHSRFRPTDREHAMRRVESGPAPGRGLVIVSTQVIEAGVDLSARTLITESAPWSSIVQRAGRCNRWGELDDARLIVVESSRRGPYEPESVERAWSIAGDLERRVVTPDTLAALESTDPTGARLMLRRKDLLDLFDTTPDLAGNDVDVSRFIRADGDLDVSVAWRSIPDAGLADLGRRPSRAERCPVPIGEMRAWMDRLTARVATYDPIERTWRPARKDDVRPGAELVVDVSAGGYSAEAGFDPTIKAAVEPISPQTEPVPTFDDDRDGADDPLTTELGVPTELSVHLRETADEAKRLCDELPFVDPVVRGAVCHAAWLHDLGKAHPIFQAALHERSPGVDAALVLAKSGTRGRLPIPKDRTGLRHELVSALVLDAHPELATGDGLDPDLVTYLVAAHHGRIRLAIRSMPGEPSGQALGVRAGDEVGVVDLGDGVASPATELHLEACVLGGRAPGQSWSSRAERLLDEHGPFRLAWMETLVRVADWRASARAGMS